jgi:hypothetical protein
MLGVKGIEVILLAPNAITMPFISSSIESCLNSETMIKYSLTWLIRLLLSLIGMIFLFLAKILVISLVGYLDYYSHLGDSFYVRMLIYLISVFITGKMFFYARNGKDTYSYQKLLLKSLGQHLVDILSLLMALISILLIFNMY